MRSRSYSERLLVRSGRSRRHCCRAGRSSFATRPGQGLLNGAFDDFLGDVLVLLLCGTGGFQEDLFPDSIFDEFGEIAFAAAAVFGEVPAEGLVGFGGDYEIPAGCVGSQAGAPGLRSISVYGYADKHPLSLQRFNTVYVDILQEYRFDPWRNWIWSVGLWRRQFEDDTDAKD